ncbi:Flavodoxin [Salinivirga cyanobacteriivorans]|uniref:Flavodoxin n=1 Tax=Salinivirga cyanobacteriivorans TaxID=1307839 RepID=A0A0S2I4I9_9BACT|nr:flavodoxin [Salinivirga cyanobacteriivorans]ALO17230.1 Flavodoxin [Salinivirga cyanobacteriivorans]
MNKTAIFYGSSTGNTESVAKQIAKLLNADVFDVADNPVEELKNYDNLIFGASTWGIGDLQDDWDNYISELENTDLSGKVCAIFGLGDGASYADSFVDGIGTIYKAIENKGCKIAGFVETTGYDYEASTAEIDGKFVGLPLDEDNESNLTNDRIDKWVEQLKAEFK